MKIAKKFSFVALAVATLHSTPVLAQWAVINPTSDIIAKAQHAASYAQAADAYAKQALQLQNQIMQYQAMIQNLQENPLGVVVPNLTLLATNTARIKQNGVNIANNMADVDDNIARAFKNPQGEFGVQFRVWSNASSDALKGAMLNAGLQREQFKDDEKALQALVTKNAASGGALAAAKTLGEINSAQLAEAYKLRELISAQQLATNTQMMAANAQALKAQTAREGFFKEHVPRTPTFSSSGGRK
ncbi:P-type conjugative transfer protein TrbJ [Massilia sp. MP_M2]|uniref:hypothetical protein n=1 Tax=Massilia sp. MP_M2 TaxID=3071713 RepID=UPI00319E96F9